MSKYGNAIEAGNFSDISVCPDCVSAIANGDKSGNSPEWDAEKYLATMATYDVVLGAIHSGPYAHRCSHVGSECADDCDCTHEDFSTLPCDVCESRLAGSRESAITALRSLLE